MNAIIGRKEYSNKHDRSTVDDNNNKRTYEV